MSSQNVGCHYHLSKEKLQNNNLLVYFSGNYQWCTSPLRELYTDSYKPLYCFILSQQSFHLINVFVCFNLYPIVVPYRVLVVTSRKFQATTSANTWICVSGEINDSKMISIPKNSQDFVLQVNKFKIQNKTKNTLETNLTYQVHLMLINSSSLFIHCIFSWTLA